MIDPRLSKNFKSQFQEAFIHNTPWESNKNKKDRLISLQKLMCDDQLTIQMESQEEKRMHNKPVESKPSVFTTSTGMPVDDNQNSVTPGEQGPMLMMDFHYLDKMAHFDRQRIPERVVHAKGAGAYGYFKVAADITKYTKAKLFDTIGKVTPIFLRFSLVAVQRGGADTNRDPRGFAIKFYTQDGIWDMVANNTPVFFIRDPIKFPDFIHSQKRNPKTNLRSATAMWDFWTLVPQSCHQVTILMSDRGTPDGYRHMHGFGSNTFRMVNKEGVAHWVKFHFMTKSGVKNLSGDQADKLRGQDPDYATRDLAQHLESGKTSQWSLYIQAMPEEEAKKYRFDIFDVTKVIFKKDYPLIYVGELVLNRNPDNFFAQTEQVAFSPGNLVPGIEPSPDKMLQGRLFSYPDTHRHRLGANFFQIPINCPYRTKTHNALRDGPMTVNGNQNDKPNYEPNSFSNFKFDQNAAYSPYRVTGMVGRFKPNHPNSDFEQPGQLYRRVMKQEDRQALIQNLVNHLRDVPRDIQQRAIKIFHKCDAEYGSRLSKKLGFPTSKSRL